MSGATGEKIRGMFFLSFCLSFYWQNTAPNIFYDISYYWDSNFYYRVARFICSSNFVFFFLFNPNTYYLSFERAFCMSKLFIARINLLIVRAQMWHVSIATIVRVLPYSFVKKLKSPEKFSVKVLVRLESILILNKNF